MSAATLPAAQRPAVYIIHDNPEWIPPFEEAFAAEGVDFVEWLLTEDGLGIDLAAEPPEGIFWSRLSASSHTRAEAHVKEYGRAVLAWLEAAGRTVINGSAVYELEVSKIRQHRLLQNAGFSVPRTAAVFGHHGLPDAAAEFQPPFITKHNQGGKGLGVRRFDSQQELAAAAADFAPGGENEPVDGITLIQDYIQPAEPFITRAEFIGGRFHYAVQVDVSGGSFELCPAEACEVPQPGIAAAVCEVPSGAQASDSAVSGAGAEPDADAEGSGAQAAGAGAEPDAGAAASAPSQFSRREDITAETPLVQKLEAFLAEQGVELAGVEFIEAPSGEQVVYDVNTNTNYNPVVEAAEREAGRVPAAQQIVRFLGERLRA